MLFRVMWSLLVAFVDPGTASWPGFLGPKSADVSDANTPLQWSAKEHVAWQVPLSGYGQSSPVVWNSVVYVTMIDGQKKETLRVVAYKLESGEKIWSFDTPTKNQGENTDYFSRAAPTPVVDEAGLVVFFEGGDLLALDHSGKVRWTRDLVAEFGAIKSRHGLSSSLVQDDKSVFVWIEREESPYLLSVAKQDGKDIWKIERKGGISWSSPVLLPVAGGEKHLVLSAAGNSPGGGGPPRGGSGAGGRPGAGAPGAPAAGSPPAGAAPAAKPVPGSLVGYDPATGRELWRVEGLSGNTSPTPWVVSEGKLLIGASAGREGGPSAEAIRTNGLVAAVKNGDEWKADYVWRSEKATCGFCSPMAHEGFAYFTDRRGMLFCLDIETGKEVYAERLGHPVWATPLGIGSRVYFVGEEGVTTVVAAGSKFEKLASNELWAAEPSAEEGSPQAMLGRIRQYAVAAVPGSLLIRRGDILYCVR